MKMDKEYLEQLSDSELESLFTVEDVEDLPDSGIIGNVKNYILLGKKDFTLGKRINEIEAITMRIVVNRWLKMVKK